MEIIDTSVCADCEETGEWPEPKPGEMGFLIASAVAYLAYGGYVVVRRRPRWLPFWLGALITWFTVCKYLICTRCERYGEACDFYYLGKWASRLFERQPDRTLDSAGIIAEGGSVALMQFVPLAAALGSPRMLLTYLVLLGVGQWAQLSVCCSRCVDYSKDPWKRDTCPSYKIAQRMFGPPA